jgi:hypothetical protein
MQIWDDNQPTNEIVPSFVAGSNNMSILLTDNDDDSNTYSYKPAIIIPALNNYYISLDPKIINRPT